LWIHKLLKQAGAKWFCGGSLRNRIITILLFPVIAFIFMIGWIMYWIGKQKENTEKKPQRNSSSVIKDAEEPEKDSIEVGLMEELDEEKITAE
jgi:hypothetical protein